MKAWEYDCYRSKELVNGFMQGYLNIMPLEGLCLIVAGMY